MLKKLPDFHCVRLLQRREAWYTHWPMAGRLEKITTRRDGRNVWTVMYQHWIAIGTRALRIMNWNYSPHEKNETDSHARGPVNSCYCSTVPIRAWKAYMPVLIMSHHDKRDGFRVTVISFEPWEAILNLPRQTEGICFYFCFEMIPAERSEEVRTVRVCCNASNLKLFEFHFPSCPIDNDFINF